MPANHRLEATVVRGGVVEGILAEAVRGIAAPTVLDCGGGTGRYAVPLAASGAAVTVVDISADALATLRRRAEDAHVAERIVAVQGDVEAPSDALGALVSRGGFGGFDLVLAHGILEVVDSAGLTFAGIAATVRRGGLLSVLVGNPAAVVLGRALAGDLAGAERELALLDADGDQPGPDLVQRLCAEHGLVVQQVHGIGVFRDLVPGSALDAPGAREALDRVEDACAQRSPFAEIAARVHVLARRPAS
ncbi:MAG TPA: methyltransferase domain-containing protein [Jatrophihabitantaceae bacterium]